MPKQALFTIFVIASVGVGALPAFAEKSPRSGPPPLAEMDANADKQLTQAELTSGLSARFQEADTSRDGYLSADELKAHANARRERLNTAVSERFDADGDGQLSESERDAARDGSRNVSKANKGRRDAGARGFERLDADQNGQLSLAEFSMPMDRLFATADTNQDQVLTFAELQATKPDRKR